MRNGTGWSLSAAASNPAGSAVQGVLTYSLNGTGWSASCWVGAAPAKSGATVLFAAGTDLLTCHVLPSAPNEFFTLRVAPAGA